ncbi:hypothetical protein Bca4012_052158 [Brassica carinata]
MDSNPPESLPSPPESLPCRSSIFTHGVQEIIQMDLKTSKMILLDKHMRAMVSDFSLSKLAVDRAFHVSGILSRAQLDIWSPSVGVEAISNEHFRVDYTSNMHQTVIENRGLRFSTLLAGFSMEVKWLALDESIEKMRHNVEVFLGRKCHDLGGEEGTVYVVIRELEDKAKEVSELKTERHKKKLNIDELEGIARLNLAEAAML